MEHERVVAEVLGLVDPAERARRAGELIDLHQQGIAELSRVRREAVEDLLSRGETQTSIAQLLGMSRARIGQLLSTGPRPERAFLGTGSLTVALGGKIEAAKDTGEPGPVLSAEAFAAYQHLDGLARSVGLSTSHEVVSPPGLVDLNRPNLIVVCGPRLSPLVAQVLAADSTWRWRKDDAGWFIEDRAGTIYRSPADQGESKDIGYIARLPRPDGRGTFLYLAGLHATGSLGAAHFLESNLQDLYKEVKTRRFSLLVECEFDQKHHIVSSKMLSAVHRHEGL
jgi:hypothetical protein